MIGRTLPWVFAIGVAVAAGASRAAAAPAPAADEPDAAYTTPTWREPRVPLELHWQLLALPEYVVELALMPAALAVDAVERYQLHRRFYDFLRNDAGTIAVVPRAKFALGDGVGIGAWLKLEPPLGTGTELKLGGLVRINGDHELDARYEQTFPSLEGRTIELSFEYEVDHDLPFYGIGEQTADKYVIEDRELRALADVGLLRPGTERWGGGVQVGFARDSLATGVAAGTEIPLEPGGPVDPPPGFDATTDLARAAVELSHDTRDATGKTTRGALAEVAVAGSISVGGGDLSAVKGTASWQQFLPLAPRFRVLVLTAGAAAVAPIRGRDDIPLHDHVILGRTDHLRGYNRYRFVDRYGWWASAEYRYEIWEYQTSDVSLLPALFVEAGNTGGDAGELFSADVHYDAGIGLRGETDSEFLVSIELGMSPEGIELGLAIGKDL